MYVLPDLGTGVLLGSFAPILPMEKLKEIMVCNRQEMMEKACLEPNCDIHDFELDISTREMAVLNDLGVSWRPVSQQKPGQQLSPSSVLRNIRCEAVNRCKSRKVSNERCGMFSHLTRYEGLHSLWKDYCTRHSIEATEHLSSRNGRKVCVITANGELQVEGAAKTWAHARSQAICKALNHLSPELLQSISATPHELP